MQLNTLNRVIATFLVGAFVITVSVFALGSKLGGLVEAYFEDAFATGSGVVLALALFALTVFLGTVVDAVGNLTTRWWIRHRLARSRRAAWWFFCALEFDAKSDWRRIFLAELTNHPTYQDLIGRGDDVIKALSAGIFFRTAEKEHSEWLVQHHSMYHLSANLVVVGFFGAVWCVAGQAWLLAACSIAISYLLMTFALDNHLYTYQLAFRNAYLALAEKRGTNA